MPPRVQYCSSVDVDLDLDVDDDRAGQLKIFIFFNIPYEIIQF